MTQATNGFICSEDGCTDVYKPQSAFILSHVHTNPVLIPGTPVRLDSPSEISEITCATAITSIPVM